MYRVGASARSEAVFHQYLAGDAVAVHGKARVEQGLEGVFDHGGLLLSTDKWLISHLIR